MEEDWKRIIVLIWNYGKSKLLKKLINKITIIDKIVKIQITSFHNA